MLKSIAALVGILLLSGCVTTSGPEVISSTDRARKTPAPQGEVVFPSGEGPHPAVVMMHGCDGLSPATRKALGDQARALRQNGYATLVLDSFGPRGQQGGHVCDSFDVLLETRNDRLIDAHEALDHLASLDEVDEDNIFVMGLSHGGGVAIRSAQTAIHDYVQNIQRRFTGAAAFYAPCSTLTMGPVDRPLLMLVGEKDDWTPPEECVQIARDRPDEPMETIVYPGALHSFVLEIPRQRAHGHWVGGQKFAREDSTERMIEFFDSLVAQSESSQNL